MGLSQDIVVRSRFSVSDGRGGGSRGGTPGQFIIRYMSRNEAIENIAPTKLRDDHELTRRYDDREAMFDPEKAKDDPLFLISLPKRSRNIQKNGGVAFSNGDPSMSDKALRDVSRDIQAGFDAGKTAIETVVSFTDEYLLANGILDPEFVHDHRGDFLGHVDQLKLRLAVMQGISRMARDFDDLRFAGVVHVNTNHVHCHLVMMDFGRGRLASDGTQKGMLTARNKDAFRRGVDMYLDDKQSVRMMSSSVMHDRRNLLCYVKKYTHMTMQQQGLPQFLLACLPENRNWWRADTNRREMRKANAIVRDFVMDILQPDPGRPSEMYSDAMRSVTAYADARQRREGFGEDKRIRLIREGEERLVRNCMNGVYSVMKSVPRDALVVRTPMMDAMSMDYEGMAARAVDDPMLEFGFRLRSYSSRLSVHRSAYHRFRHECEEYEKVRDEAEDQSRALAEHLRLERDYQRMLMVKYLHFLAFMPPDEPFEEEFDKVLEARDRMERMDRMESDSEMAAMQPGEADAYGRRTYGIDHASHIRTLPAVWSRRKEQARNAYAALTGEFRRHLQDYGFDFDGHGVKRRLPYPFDRVKALDLHHLGYDFPYDAQVSRANVDAFADMADRRYESFLRAKEYLENTGQGDLVGDLLPEDVTAMKAFADRMRSPGQASLKSARPGGAGSHSGRTVRLGRDYTGDMKEAVKAAAETSRQMT